MTATQVDEESPLLGSQQLKPKRTPLPMAQFSLVLFLQLAEPLTSQVIYPFLPQVCSILYVYLTSAHCGHCPPYISLYVI